MWLERRLIKNISVFCAIIPRNMPNTFTTSTTTGYGNRIINSVKGVVVGCIFIIGAFGLLYWNEGRKDLSSLARQSTAISAEQVASDASLQGKLVSVSGALTSTGQIGDGLFLQPGGYVSVARKVEMYAWVETKNTESHSNAGGSQTDTTTYTYKQEWTHDPQASQDFAHPEEHANPTESLSDTEVRAESVHVGAYAVGDMNGVTLPSGSPVTLSAQNTSLSGRAVLANQQYIFVPNATSTGSLSNPEVGDIRISYSSVHPGMRVTLMGKLDGAAISSYVDQDNNELYRIFSGTRAEAISQLHAEYETLTWILRVVGFVLMLIGFMLIASPIATILDIIPLAGSISSGIIFLFAFLLSIVLTVITILVSMLVHNLVVLLVAVALVIGGVIFWCKRKKAPSTQSA